MPQNGLHGLVGLATAKALARKAPPVAREPFTFGIVFGAMLPDVDMYPTGVAFLLGRKDLVYVIHRTATHSLVVLAAALLVTILLWNRRRTGLWLSLGLIAGATTHSVLDVFFWFTQIDLFWPLSHLPPHSPLLPMVDLWQGRRMEGLAYNIREAFEFAAFALFLRGVRTIVMKVGGKRDRVVSLRKWEFALWLGFTGAMVSAFIFQDRMSVQNYIVTTPYLLLFLPYCWKQAWNFRAEISQWASGEKVPVATAGD